MRLEVDGETFALFMIASEDSRAAQSCLRGVMYKDDGGTRLEVRWGGFVTPPIGIFLALFTPILVGVAGLRIGTVAALVSGLATLLLLVVGMVVGVARRGEEARRAYAELVAALDGIIEPLRLGDGNSGYR